MDLWGILTCHRRIFVNPQLPLGAHRLGTRMTSHPVTTAGDGGAPETVPDPKYGEYGEPTFVSEGQGPASPIYTGKEETPCSDTAQGSGVRTRASGSPLPKILADVPQHWFSG